MKKATYYLSVLFLLMFQSLSYGAFVSGSTGADGALNIASGTITLPPSGILNYTTVNITGTVIFTPNATNTPVVILATGDVNISGTINVSGTTASTLVPGKGGPGGFDGGYGAMVTGATGGRGQGPGGGSGSTSGNPYAGSGSYATAQTNCTQCGATYGNPYIVPALGGSGGGGGYLSSANGGGGGGVIVIASSGTANITGAIYAYGGNASSGFGGNGSGGAIRIIANTIKGEGAIGALGTNGNNGYIRLETTNNMRGSGTSPMYVLGRPSSVFGSNQPSLAITAVGGIPVTSTATPRYSQPDIAFTYGTTSPVTVDISASNIPVGSTVKVRAIPQNGADTVVTTTLTGTLQSSTGSASITVPTTVPSIISVETTFTAVALNYENEEVSHIRVASTIGGKSQITYITKSGREIKIS